MIIIIYLSVFLKYHHNFNSQFLGQRLEVEYFGNNIGSIPESCESPSDAAAAAGLCVLQSSAYLCYKQNVSS